MKNLQSKHTKSISGGASTTDKEYKDEVKEVTKHTGEKIHDGLNHVGDKIADGMERLSEKIHKITHKDEDCS